MERHWTASALTCRRILLNLPMTTLLVGVTTIAPARQLFVFGIAIQYLYTVLLPLQGQSFEESVFFTERSTGVLGVCWLKLYIYFQV